MTSITGHYFFNANELPRDAVLSGAELESAFWQLKKLQRESLQQQGLWRSLNDSLSGALAKLASVEEALRLAREELREANAQIGRKVAGKIAALREAREFAENVVASISDMLLVVDVAGVVRQANRAAFELLGLREGELLGRSIREIVASDPAETPRLPEDWLEVALRHGEVKNRDAVCVGGALKPLPVVFSAARLQRPGARVLGAVCIAKDASERRQGERVLRERLDQIRTQQETIRALITPVIRVGEKVIVLPVVGSLDRVRAADIMADLLRAVAESRPAFAIVDLPGAKAVDFETTDHLLRLTRAVASFGARCLVSGLPAPAAQRVASLGTNLHDLVSFSSLETALRHALGELDRRAQSGAGAAGRLGPDA
jgi:rsbT co-antagonist protein RsbR